MPPALVKALLRQWISPNIALAYAKAKLDESMATGCPFAIREYRTAVRWLEWIVGDAPIVTEPITDDDIKEVMTYRRPPFKRPNSHRSMSRKLRFETERG
jgi:hypothetical protein